ncbi:MAG: trimethylamine methyltransferase family protein [Anaerolineae bacterium]|nr:trimethylamine methyltransferase family protein [Anaerolineae bacterium]
MYAAGHAYNLMSLPEVRTIHGSALRILDEMGMVVEHAGLLAALADAGMPVDAAAQRVRFPPRTVERFIADADKHDWAGAVPRVSGSAGVYHGLYHDPASGKHIPWTEDALAAYVALAQHLDHVDGASVLGSRIPVPGPLEPLYERYYSWKHGAAESGSIHLDALCPYLIELYEVWAGAQGVPLSQAFRGTVYVVPPLKLGRHEAYQVAYFRAAGLRVSIGGGMLTMGATAPVTLAGAVTLNLAEQLALRILDWVLWGEARLHLGSSLAGLDMRTTIRPFGRPEMGIANLMTAQLARFYGASFAGHAGLTDAKVPSAEAGAQKALTGIPTLLAGGRLWVDAGLLSIDEVCSPIQMVLDNEWIDALARFAHAFEVSEETIGLETILAAGPGGQYLDKMHTARHHRAEHWQPRLWSRHMLGPWLADGARTDVDRAREIALQVGAELRQKGRSRIAPHTERDLLRVIERARAALL